MNGGSCQMICPNCKGDSFRFIWKWKDDKDLRVLTLCHEGYGLELKSAECTCVSCGQSDLDWEVQDGQTHSQSTSQ